MTMLYDTECFQKEIFYEDLAVGQEFPSYRYRVSGAHVDAYLAAAEQGLQEEAKDRMRSHRLLPSLVALNFGFVYSAMRHRPPTGFLNSAVEIDLLEPAPVDADLVMTVCVDDKQIKRDRKRVVFKAAVEDERGRLLSVIRIACVFP